MDRRTILKALPFLGGATALPVAAISAQPSLTAQERRDYHLAEYQRACEELDPMLDRWSVTDGVKSHVVTGIRVSGRYVGDGFYECRTDAGTRCINYVELTPEKIDGHRTFFLTAWPKVGRPFCRATEPHLMEIIVNRHSGRFGAAS